MVAFLDNSTAVMGDPAGVEATIQRSQGAARGRIRGSGQSEPVEREIRFLVSDAGAGVGVCRVMPDQNMGQAMQGNLFQAVLQASGGAKLGAEYVMFERRSGDAVGSGRFRAGGRGEVRRRAAAENKNKNSTATQFSTSAGYDVGAIHRHDHDDGDLRLPEPMMEQLFQSTKSGTRHAPGSTPVVAPAPIRIVITLTACLERRSPAQIRTCSMPSP